MLHLSPEVEEDAGGEYLLLVLGRQKSDGLLEVDSPQLAEDKGVEERAHVNHRSLRLLSEPGQDYLKMTRGQSNSLFVTILAKLCHAEKKYRTEQALCLDLEFV